MFWITLIIAFTLDELQWSFRNLKIPFLFIKDFKLKTLFIDAWLSREEDSEFTLKYEEKIFEKYSLPATLRKLYPKNFYNAEISSSKMCFNIQGFETKLMMFDLNWFFKRFAFADLCDSFPKDYKIKLGFTPLDLLRYRYHGKLTMNLENNEINIYKQRNFQRHDPRFRLIINQIEFFQEINNLEWLIKSISIEKFPMKEFETKLLHIPLVENICRFQYNKEGVNNHYRHVGCETIAEYIENIKDYSTHNISIEILLHIPSLRHKDALEVALNQQLLPYFIDKSNVGVFHFQKSYMSQIYDFM